LYIAFNASVAGPDPGATQDRDKLRASWYGPAKTASIVVNAGTPAEK
jgi:hypothetical protein